MNATGLTVDYFPYAPGLNPYQIHFKNALEQAGAYVNPVEPQKLFPLSRLARAGGTIAHVDWISDLYIGRSALSALAKRLMFAAGLQRLARRRVVWTVHNLFTHDSPMQRHRESELIRSFVRRCSGLLFLSARSMDEFAHQHALPEHVLLRQGRIGHFADDYLNDGDPLRARAALGIAADRRVALLLGRLQAYKGIEELLAAFARTATSDDVLLVAGAPSSLAYARQLEELARSLQDRCDGHIQLVAEEIQPDHMQDYFNAADVTVMPFKTILNSASLLLAASFGLPVVAPAIGSVPEYIPSEVGWVYDPDAADLADVVRAALDAAPEAMTARAERVQFVRTHFRWSELADVAISMYDDIVRTPRLRA